VNYCWTHIYGGLFRCPWPECAEGQPEAEFEFHGKHVSRQRFGDVVDQPVYAWVVDGVNAAYVAAQLARRAIAQVNGAPSLAEDGYLYHFTSAAGLRGILASGELWLTDYRDFIDDAEIRDGLTVAKATFDTFAPDVHSYTREIFRRLVGSPLAGEVYVACFCMLKDAPYHWSAYAADSSGGALVMDPLGFERLIASDPFAIQFSRVAYVWDVKAGLFAHLAVWLDELIRFDVEREVFDADAYLREMAQIFGELLPMCKDVSFFREHEVRLVASPASSRFGLGSRLRARRQNGRRHVTTRDVLGDFSLPIEKVLLGPMFAADVRSLNIEKSKLEQ
jgi:hypothetical protein